MDEMMVGAAEAVQPIGAPQIAEAMETLKRYKAGKQSLERRIVASEEWWKLRNWEQMRPQGNPLDAKWRSAWLFNVIMGKHADAVAAYPEPAIRPREAADRAEAGMLTSIVPVILEQNDFEQVYSDSAWTKLKQGTLAWAVLWDKNKLNGLGDIAVKEVDLLNLFWEPGISDIQKSRNVFCVELIDNRQLVQRYPQLDGRLRPDPGLVAKYRTDDAVDTSDKSLVVDWYYRKTVGGKSVLHFAKFVGEEVLAATENDPAMRERGLYDDGGYPFVIDALFPVKGSICGYGYIEIGKSAQEQIDLLNQAIVKNAVMAASPRFFVRADGAVNEKEFADWTKPFVHVDGNLGADSIAPVSAMQINSNYINILLNKIEELKWTTGNTDVNNGATSSGVTAASAIAALQEASGRSSKDSTKSAYRAYARLVRMVIERIRQFYDLPRRFRITGSRGIEEYVSYSNAGLKERRMLGLDGVEAIRKPIFDIAVSAQKATEYTKVAQNELVLQLYQLGFFSDGAQHQALLALDAMDFEGKDELAQKIAQQGTLQQELAKWQRMAIGLAQRISPEMAEGLAASVVPGQQPTMRADAGQLQSAEQREEPSRVQAAREQAQQAAQPD